jgi:FAD dependent oxidoreductase
MVLLVGFGLLAVSSTARKPGPEIVYDVVVYGGTASGVMAAISASQAGMRTALVEPGQHLGGMVSGGLSVTDVGDPAVIGGRTAAFFSRIRDQYQIPALAWRYEPHVAEAEFDRELEQAGVTVYLGQRLREHGGVDKSGSTINRLLTESGLVLAARVFVDSSYEGDLLAQAGVTFTVGRESAATYGESLAGYLGAGVVQAPIDGRDAAGSALPGVGAVPDGSPGSSDAKVEAYTFRLCVTQRPDDLLPFPEPSGYRPADFALVGRDIEAHEQRDGQPPRFADLVSLNEIPNGKADLNDLGPVSTDLVGGSWAYPNATNEQRTVIWQVHQAYEQGFLYFLGHDPTVPQALRSDVATWGLCRDEFVDSGGWPTQLYVREARRMVGDVVLDQADVQGGVTGASSIALGSYEIDSHVVQRYVDASGRLVSEGLIASPTNPYGIPYGVLVPREDEASNLLVSVAVSASHVAFSSVRMEPQFMMMGEAAGTAAALAVAAREPVQRVDVPTLRARLLAHGTVLEP